MNELLGNVACSENTNFTRKQNDETARTDGEVSSRPAIISEISKQLQIASNTIPSIVEIIALNAPKKKQCDPQTITVVEVDANEPQYSANNEAGAQDREEEHLCIICHANFSSTYLLRKHLHQHTGDKKKVTCKTFDEHTTGSKSVEKQWFKCEKCLAKFETTQSLMLHFRMHQFEKSFICGICNERFRRKTELSMHSRTHIGEKPFECTKCEAKYSSAAGLKYHMKAVHTKETPYQCTICEEKFRIKATFESHLRAHNGEKPFKCELCEAKYGTKAGLKYHIKLHKKKEFREKAEEESRKDGSNIMIPEMDEIFQCSICDALYKSRSGLKYHLMTHTGEKPFTCTICEAKFTRKNVLKVHQRKHTGDTPHICGLCGTKYITKDGLKFHLLTHSDIKPFQCTFCGSGFTRKDLLNSHIRSHTGEKPFKCSKCSAEFGWRSLLQKHVKKLHPLKPVEKDVAVEVGL